MIRVVQWTCRFANSPNIQQWYEQANNYITRCFGQTRRRISETAIIGLVFFEEKIYFEMFVTLYLENFLAQKNLLSESLVSVDVLQR